MGSEAEVTAADREKAAQLSGCVLDDHPGAPFCASHDEDGNPPWHRCRWVPIAQALADERAKARVPFRILAAQLDSEVENAEVWDGTEETAFREIADRIRRAAEDPPEVSQT